MVYFINNIWPPMISSFISIATVIRELITKIRGIAFAFIIAAPDMFQAAHAFIGLSPYHIDVLDLAIQLDGRILVAGDATIAGNSRNFIVRLNTDGSLDSTFEPNNCQIAKLLVQTDGKILIGGHVPCFDYALVRLNPDGSVDKNFNLDPRIHSINAIALQEDGKILVGTYRRQHDNAIYRLHPDGSIDTTFKAVVGPNKTASDYVNVTCIVLQADGKILAGGKFETINGQPRANIARLHPDGGLDMTFNSEPDNSIRAIAVLPDGKILVSGTYTQIDDHTRHSVARLHANGILDLTFAPDIIGEAISIDVQADGKILVGGIIDIDDSDNHMGRLNSDGSVDPTFNASTSGIVFKILEQLDSKILIGGLFSRLQGRTGDLEVWGLARLKADGSIDSTFKPWTDSLIDIDPTSITKPEHIH